MVAILDLAAILILFSGQQHIFLKTHNLANICNKLYAFIDILNMVLVIKPVITCSCALYELKVTLISRS